MLGDDDRLFLRDQSAFADGFVEGVYLFHRSGRVGMPVRVWFGPPHDPVTGSELDRSWRWQLTLAGVPIDDSSMASLEDVWPRCLAHRVDEAEEAYRNARIDHARRHDPRDPFGHYRGQIDWIDASPPF